MDAAAWDEGTGDLVMARLLSLLPATKNRPAIVAVAGPSGVGKSRLAARLASHLVDSGYSAHVLGMDDFFYSKEYRNSLGEWGPDHVRFHDLERVLTAVTEGNPIPVVKRYLRKPKAHLKSWLPDLADRDVVVFEGLYALSQDIECGNLGRFADIKVFLDAPDQLLKKWRFEQEAAKPAGRDNQAMEHHWREGIAPDTRDRVRPSGKDAHIRLGKDTEHRFTIELPLD